MPDGGAPSPAADPPERALVGGVVVAVEFERLARRQPRQQFLDELGKAPFHGLRIGPALLLLEFVTAALLEGGHRALAAQRGVIEAVDEGAAAAGGEVDVEGMVLGVGEGLEAVDDDGLAKLERGRAIELAAMEEQAVAGAAGDVTGDGRVGDAEVAGHLPQSGSLDGPGEDGGEEIAAAEPVGGREGACGELAAAVAAAIGLEAAAVGGPAVVAVLDVVPVLRVEVARALGIGAMGRAESAPAADPSGSGVSPLRHARRASQGRAG